MATNPRNTTRGRKAADKDPKEDPNMSTTEATPEAPEAEAPKEPKEPKEHIDHEGNLYAAIITFGADSNVASLQEAYRAVPAAARGKVQGVAMKRAMTEGGVDMDVLGSVLDAFNNLPAATKSRTAKPTLDEGTLNAIKLAGLMVAYKQAHDEAGDEAHAVALEWYNGTAPDEHQAAITKIASNVLNAAAKGGRGGSGSRTSLSEKLPELLARGALEAGSILTGANDATATVNADGSVTTNGETFPNLSAAARSHRVKDGKATSTNGWDFWTIDGKPVGELRKS